MVPTAQKMPRGMVLLLAAALSVTGCGVAQAQSPEQIQERPPLDARADSLPRPQPIRPDQRLRIQSQRSATRAMIDLRRRLLELDRLLTLGNLDRAAALLNELAMHRALQRDLVIFRIRLASLRGEHAEVIELCEEELTKNAAKPRLWREMANALLALDRYDEARTALDRFVATSPTRRSSLMVAVNQLRKSGHPTMALGLIDSARSVLDEPRFLGRARAMVLLSIGRQSEAGDEMSAELRARPFNLPLARRELLDGPFSPLTSQPLLERLAERAAEPQAVPAEALLVANLHLQGGDDDAAVSAVEPLLKSANGSLLLLQNCATLSRELSVDPEAERRGATITYLLRTLEELGIGSALDPALRPRALESLAFVCEQALGSDSLGPDPRRAVAEYERLLSLVRQRHPQAPQLYSAQIRLAHYTRDVLGEPRRAAVRLERLLTDLDLPTEGVALARLTLGECYLADGDTARGRLVLTRLGTDPDFRQAAGHAHFHLARLDLAEGHFMTARERFAAVAIDAPAAPYANDALELGLAVAEEMENPTGGPPILALYARAVYFDVTAQPDSQLVALERFVAEAPRLLDLSAPQYLLERGRYELALLYLAAGRTGDALDQLTRIVGDHPDGRYPAQALALSGHISTEAGDPDTARDTYERLLIQYPDYLFSDDIRDEVRSLP